MPTSEPAAVVTSTSPLALDPLDAVRSVKWSLSFAAICAYTLTAVTQRLEITTVAIVLAFVGMYAERRLHFATFLVPLGIFLLWGYAHAGQGLSPETSYRGLEVLLKVAVIAFAVAAVTADGLRLRVLAFVYVGSFLIYPVRGALLNYFVVGHTLLGRAIWNNIYENPNDLAALSFFPLALTVWLAQTSRGLLRFGLFGAAGLQVLVILLTQSRGALIALVVGALLYLATRSKGRRIRSILLAGGLVMLVIPFVPSTAWERFSGMSNLTSTATIGQADEEGSAAARWAIWQTATAVIKDYPITGVGYGAYLFANWQYGIRLNKPRGARGPRDAHSTYLSVAAETGFVGLMLFLIIVAIPMVAVQRARRHTRDPATRELLLALSLGFVCYMTAGIFGSFAKLAIMYVQLAVMSAAAAYALREARGTPVMRSAAMPAT
jgi:O-antigen ligase